MNKKDFLYVGIFVIVFAVAVFGVSIFKKNNPKTENIDSGEILDNGASSTEAGEDTLLPESEEAPAEYFDLLSEARELISSKKYNQALSKIDDALIVYKNSQAYVLKASVYEITNNQAERRKALYEVVYTYGNLDSRYWRLYVDSLIQTKAPIDQIKQTYEDGISRIKPVAETVGISHLVDMYTGYAGYLGGNGFYSEAISYLRLAIELDPSREAVFMGEIEYLQSKM